MVQSVRHAPSTTQPSQVVFVLFAGNKLINYKDRIYTREDYNVDHKGKNIELTVYKCIPEKPFLIPYVILYMHGNSSCRVEALGLLKNMPNGISLASFDFMGCGKNEES